MSGYRRILILTLLAVLTFAARANSLNAQGAAPDPGKVNTIREVYAKLYRCWKPPVGTDTKAMDITIIVSFNRAGEILGRPRITYETATASEHDRLVYRVAVMEALQRCTPMPFTDSMAGAVAGHPFAVQFRNIKLEPEKKAWLPPRIL